MFHFTSSTPNWPTVIPGEPPLAVKAVDRGDILREAKQNNPGTFTILRHWVQHQQFGGDFDENCDRAQAFFATFIDDTFRTQYAPYVDAVEEYNEYLANSQTPEEIDERVLWAEAAAQVWAEDYQTQPEYEHIKLVLCNTAVGNTIDRRFAETAIFWDFILGYHPYTLYESGQRWDGDWLNLSGRWAVMEEQWGLRPTWAFTECGPFRNAVDGWRHPGCLGGDIGAYVAAVRAWLEDVRGTDAYQEGRIAGFNLFNSGDPEGTWRWYETTISEMVPLAAMIREEWQYMEPPPPPPEPTMIEGIDVSHWQDYPIDWGAAYG